MPEYGRDLIAIWFAIWVAGIIVLAWRDGKSD